MTGVADNKENTECMIQDARKHKGEDETRETKVSSKSSLESSAFNITVTTENNKLQGKINDKDKVKIPESVMKSSVGCIRIKLQIKKNFNTSRKN